MASDKQQMSADVLPLLQDKNFVFVATIMEDGSPQITPTWVDVEQDGTVLVNTAMGRVKQKNVTRDPRVAVSVIDKNNPYHTASIRGKVIEQTRKGADEHIDKMAKKYLGMDKYPFRSPSEERVILRIKAEKVSHIKPR